MMVSKKVRQFAEGALNLAVASAPKNPITTKEDAALAMIHARCIRAGCAALLLCDHGFGEDAMNGSRALDEVTLAFRVLCADQSLMPTYVCWGGFEELRRAQRNPGWLPPEEVKKLEATVAAFDKIGVSFKPNARHWFPGGVSGLARRLDELAGLKEGDPGPEQGSYSSWYSVESSFSHATTLATFWLEPKADGTQVASPNPNGRWVDLALGLVGKHLSYLADAASDRWHGGALAPRIEANVKLWTEATEQG